MTPSDTDPRAKRDQDKITEAGAIELDESAIDQAAGGSAPPAAAAPVSLLAKAASGKF